MSQLDWNATINSIRETVPQTQFQNWLKPLRLIRCDNHSVVLGVPNKFHKEWIKTNYKQKLKEAIRHQCGTELQLEFEIVLQQDDSQQPQQTPETPPTPTRPTLRVVEGFGKTTPSETPAEGFTDLPEPTPKDPPNLPAFPQAFLELKYNTVPYQFARMFTSNRGVPVQPLVIVAGVGMGKTHLLSQLGQWFNEAQPDAQIRYTTAEAFSTELVQSIRSNQVIHFKKKYAQNTDCLIFDDIQGLSRRLKTQEELLHIFNEIISRNGSVCFSSRVAPHMLENFIEPLRSRILSGVIADIQHPNYEQRVELLNKKCALDQIPIDPTVLRSLAAQGQKDIRELLGSLIRIHLHANLENRSVDQEYVAQKAWVQEARKEAITMEEITTMVEHNFGVNRDDLTSKSRKSVIAWARQVAMYLARRHTVLSLEEIGKLFGRDHATVIHAFQKVKDIMESHPTRRYEVEFLEEKIASRSFSQEE